MALSCLTWSVNVISDVSHYIRGTFIIIRNIKKHHLHNLSQLLSRSTECHSPKIKERHKDQWHKSQIFLIMTNPHEETFASVTFVSFTCLLLSMWHKINTFISLFDFKLNERIMTLQRWSFSHGLESLSSRFDFEIC